MEKRYKTVVVDDYDGIRDFLVEALRVRGFDARGYRDAESMLSTAFEAVPLSEYPDLVVIDLQLQDGKMQGIDLVAELAEKDVPSEILVISGNLGNLELAESIMTGAGSAWPKPFDDFRIALRKMETLADMGKRRRLHRMGQYLEVDRRRLERPVFLSYSVKDKRMANGIRRNLEARGIHVWYAPAAIEGGDDWRVRIEEGIAGASIFVALVTSNYLKSAHCFAELMAFQDRLDLVPEPKLLLLPLLCMPQKDVSENCNFGPVLRDFQGIDLSNRFIDGLTLLLARIQDRLPQALSELDNKPSQPVESSFKSPSQSKTA